MHTPFRTYELRRYIRDIVQNLGHINKNYLSILYQQIKQQTSNLKHLQQSLEQLLRTTFQQLREDIVEYHLSVKIVATEPENIIFTKGYLEFAVVFYHLDLLLYQFLSASQTIGHHASFEVSQDIFRREPRIETRNFSSNEFTVFNYSSEDKIPRIKIRSVPFGCPIKIQIPQKPINRSIDINDIVISNSRLDDTHNKMILLRNICGNSLDNINIIQSSDVFDVQQSKVQTFWLTSLFTKRIRIEFCVFYMNGFTRQYEFMTVVGLLLHQIIIN